MLWQQTAFKIFHSLCYVCKFPVDEQHNQDLRWCSHCFQMLSPILRCYRCGIPMLDMHNIYQTKLLTNNGIQCGKCLTNSPIWNRLYTLGKYGFPLKQEILLIKDHKYLQKASGLTKLLATRITEPAPQIISVPLHWFRYITRGFNQSDILAKHLSKQLNSYYEPKTFKRIKYTKPQRGSHIKQRIKNMRNTFILNKKPLYDHVAIIDDVLTSGNTVTALCKLLKKSGIKRIDIYCICRTDFDDLN